MGQKFWAFACAFVLAAAITQHLAAQQAEDPFGPGPSTTAPQASEPVASDPAARSSYAPGEAENRINAALDQRLREPFDFVEQPLRDVSQILSETYDIPIQFDVAALDAVAASPDVEVHLQINNVTLRSALDLMLKNVGGEELTYIVDNEVLLITTEEEAQSRLEVKVYRVDDLLAPRPTYTLLDVDADYDSLIDLITDTIELESWVENGTGQGNIYPFPPGMLVVSQTSRVHQQISALLEEMRRTKQAIDRDHAQELETATRESVTRGYPVDGKDGFTAPENRREIIEAIKNSVDWQTGEGELSERDAFVVVFPNRIVVRHRPDIVREAQHVIYEMTQARTLPPGMGGSGYGCDERFRNPEHEQGEQSDDGESHGSDGGGGRGGF